MGFDGRDVWVTTSSAVSVYGYWDESSNYEGIHNEYFPDFYIPEPQLNLEASIDLSAYLSASEILDDVVKVYDHMYVAVVIPVPDIVLPDATISRFKLTKLIKVNIATRSFVSVHTIPISNASYNITSQNNKVWFTDLAQEGNSGSDRQKLYFYDTNLDTFSAGVDIPSKKQFDFRVITNGRDGWVLLGNNNTNSILKFDDTTGTFSAEIIVNRDPSTIYVDGNRDVIVGSADGMVSVADQTTNTATNLYSTYSQAVGLVDDGTYIWSLIPSLARTLKSTTTDNFRLMVSFFPEFEPTADYALSEHKFDSVSFTQILITTQFDYQWWNGSSFDTRTVRPYIFCLSQTGIQAFRTQALYRTNTINVKGTAMIATGSEAYYGETTA